MMRVGIPSVSVTPGRRRGRSAEPWPPPGIASRLWPDQLTTDVLHAALDGPDTAMAAWECARPHLDLRPNSRSAHRLLFPLVWTNLRREHRDHPDMAVLGLAHRETLLRNAKLVHLTNVWLDEFDAVGVRACVMKGVPLALRDYRDLGARPMGDVDVLVPVDQLETVFQVFLDAGWRAEIPIAEISDRMRASHAAAFSHPDSGHVDVHWYVNKFLIRHEDGEGSAAPFWDLAEPISVGNAHALTLCRTDALAHSIIHGAWRGSGATFRWIADAMVLARRLDEEGELDSARLVWIGEHFAMGQMLHESLRYLAEEFDAPIPPALLADLNAIPTTIRQRLRYRAATNASTGPGLMPGLPTWRAFWAQDRWGRSDREALRMLPSFLMSVLGLSDARSNPQVVLTRVRRRFASMRQRGG